MRETKLNSTNEEKNTQCKDCITQMSELNSGATQVQTLPRPQTKLRSAEPRETALNTVDPAKQSELNSGAELHTLIVLQTKLNRPRMCSRIPWKQKWPHTLWIARRPELNCVATLHTQIVLGTRLDIPAWPQTNLNTVENALWTEPNYAAAAWTRPTSTKCSTKLNSRAAPVCSRKQIRPKLLDSPSLHRGLPQGQ